MIRIKSKRTENHCKIVINNNNRELIIIIIIIHVRIKGSKNLPQRQKIKQSKKSFLKQDLK